MDNKKLRRSKNERIIGGVAGGFGNYFDTDPVIFRLLFVLLTLGGGSGIPIYILLWIFLKSDNTNNIKDIKEPNDNITLSPEEKEKLLARKKNGSIIGGSILIAIGTAFMIDEWISEFDWDIMLPIALVLTGLAIIFINYKPKNK